MGGDDGVTRFRLTTSWNDETTFIAPQELSLKEINPVLFGVDQRLSLVKLKFHQVIIMDPTTESRHFLQNVEVNQQSTGGEGELGVEV